MCCIFLFNIKIDDNTKSQMARQILEMSDEDI